jgi:hypothetical protein
METEMDDQERDLWNRRREIERVAAEAHTRATRATTDLGQRYSAETFAASGSEDPMTRSYIAWLNYQRDLGEIAHEYWTAIAACQRAASTLFHDEVEAATTSTFGRYRDTINQLVADMSPRDAGSGSGASDRPAASESPATARRRETGSQSSPKQD